jgi:DNA-binding transcriptional MerR regulator
MKRNSNPPNTQHMKISELREKSGFSKFLIQYYINIDLLHKPIKTGKTVALYDESHLEKLQRIRHFRKKKGLSLTQIKSIFDQEPGMTPADIDGYIETIVRVSYLLAEFPGIKEMDINPLRLLRDGTGSCALDARIVVERE